MATPCPICGALDCRHYLGQGVAGKRFIRTDAQILEESGPMLRLTARLYLNSDRTKVVKHGDPDAAFLLGVAGALISEADAKRLGVKDTEKMDTETVNAVNVRAQLAAVPTDPDDDSLYDDQSEAGKKARAAARDMQRAPIAEYVLSTGGTEEEAERAADEASGQAGLKLPTAEEQHRENATLVGDGSKPKGK